MRSQDLVTAVKQLHDSGSNLREIAAALGMQGDSILRALNRAGAQALHAQVRRRPLAHGAGGYKRGCRCDACTDANTTRVLALRQRRTERSPRVHGPSGFTNYGCRCDICVTEARARVNERAAIGRDSATNHRKQWTGPELELITQTKDGRRYLHTAAECALMLNRSVSAINQMRGRCAKEPKYIRLAGQRSADTTT